jgi:hypothetical protein
MALEILLDGPQQAYNWRDHLPKPFDEAQYRVQFQWIESMLTATGAERELCETVVHGPKDIRGWDWPVRKRSAEELADLARFGSLRAAAIYYHFTTK